MIEPLIHIARMAPYALADKGAPGSTSLAENESAFSPSEEVVSAAINAASLAQLYSDPDWTALREVIAQVHGLTASQILCGAGSMELIGALIRASTLR